MPALKDILEERTREAEPELYDRLERDWVRCHACGHQCRIPPGQLGVCKVRFNRAGRLLAPWGYVAGLQCDPIEKKPFHHAWPGSLAFSFGMLGCDLHCGYCQNWVTSQALRDPAALTLPERIDPETIAVEAVARGARVVVSTYNEPLITSEWAVAVFRAARAAGLATGFVSNGNATERVLDYVAPWLDLYKVDLKSFDERHYRELGGRLGPILDGIRAIHRRGLWLEVVTLIVPGFNDSDEELRRIAEFLAGVSADIPWHVTAFHQDYKMTGPRNTPAETLARAAEIGRNSGLRYVYAGNLPGRVSDSENTRCPQCRALLIERHGYHIARYRLTPSGRCPECGAAIAGRWDERFHGQITDRPMAAKWGAGRSAFPNFSS